MTERCLIFLHIPKTGGVTLRNVLRWKYPESQQMHVETLVRRPEDVMKWPSARRQNARVVMGHLHHGVHRYMPRDCDYLTLLREPVSRVLSMYRYIRGDERHWLHEELVNSHMGLEEFVDTCADPGVDNHQTRMLSGRRDDFRPGEEPSELDEEALEMAKSNLENCIAFGLTERFDESFILISRALGWRMPFYIRGNISRTPAAPASERVLEMIQKRNRFDLELYDFARARFSQLVEIQGPSFQRRVAAFRVWNRAPNRIFPSVEGMVRRILSSKFSSKRKVSL